VLHRLQSLGLVKITRSKAYPTVDGERLLKILEAVVS